MALIYHKIHFVRKWKFTMNFKKDLCAEATFVIFFTYIEVDKFHHTSKSTLQSLFATRFFMDRVVPAQISKYEKIMTEVWMK